MLLECSSRPETPKILGITPEFESKSCFFVNFAIKTVCFLWFHPWRIRDLRIFWDKDVLYFGLHLRFRGNSCIFWNKDQNLWKFAYFLRWRPSFLSLPQILSNFAMNIFVFWSTHRIRSIEAFLCPTKFVYAPTVTLSWRRPVRNYVTLLQYCKSLCIALYCLPNIIYPQGVRKEQNVSKSDTRKTKLLWNRYRKTMVQVYAVQ